LRSEPHWRQTRIPLRHQPESL